VTAQQPSVVAVTVTYGDRHAFVERIAAVLLHDPHVVQWVIVANGVGQEIEHRLMALDRRVVLVSFPTNVGSAAAYAEGIKTALDNTPTAGFLWLLDDDNLPDPEALTRLLDAHAQLAGQYPESLRTVVCAYRAAIHDRQVKGDGRRLPSSFLGFHWRSWLRTLGLRLYPRTAASAVPEFQSLATAPYGGLLLPAPLLRAAGLPDPRFVLYADDTEFTDRMVKDGCRLWLIRTATITDLCPSWQDQGRLLHAWLDTPDSARAYYGARNETWFDTHRLMTSSGLYRFHRSVYLGVLWCLSRRQPRLGRYALLVEAIRAGEAGQLGPDRRFPLEGCAGRP
jgi:GT2 family glycosyltransferase